MWINPSVSPPLFASRQPRGSIIAPVLAAAADADASSSDRDSRPASTSDPAPRSTRRPAPAHDGGGGGSPAPQPPDDGLEPSLRQFMAAQSPGIDMDSDAGAGAGGGGAGAADGDGDGDWWGWEAGGGGGERGGDAVLWAVAATRVPTEERDRLLVDRVRRALGHPAHGPGDPARDPGRSAGPGRDPGRATGPGRVPEGVGPRGAGGGAGLGGGSLPRTGTPPPPSYAASARLARSASSDRLRDGVP